MEQTTHSEPAYLNLAHQFLDTNFIEATRRNRFNVLPVLSTSSGEESFVQSEPPLAVDYFSHELTSRQYHNCWKSVANNQFMKQYELSNVDNITRLRTVQQMDDLMMFLPTTSQPRLENACWRAWYKSLKSLKELDPTEINWFKENDVTVLYGPLIDDDVAEEVDADAEASEEEEEDTYEEMLFDVDGDCKMGLGAWSPASPASMEEDVSSSSCSSSISSSSRLALGAVRRLSVASSVTSVSDSDAGVHEKTTTGTKTTAATASTPGLRSILKRRRRVPSIAGGAARTYPKKRISFSQELISVRLIA